MLKRQPLLLNFALVVVLGLFGSDATWAQSNHWQSYQQVALGGIHVKQNKASSAAEAARIAKRRHGGKVLKVETVKTNGGVSYRVKILQDDGRVKTVVISG